MAFEKDGLTGAQFSEGGQGFGRVDQERHRVVAQRLAQPAATLVVE